VHRPPFKPLQVLGQVAVGQHSEQHRWHLAESRVCPQGLGATYSRSEEAAGLLVILWSAHHCPVFGDFSPGKHDIEDHDVRAREHRGLQDGQELLLCLHQQWQRGEGTLENCQNVFSLRRIVFY